MKYTFSIVLIVVVLTGAACSKKTTQTTNQENQGTNGTNSAQANVNNTPSTNTSATVTWRNTGNGWQPSGTPPPCPSALTQSPTEVSKASSILYPGQTRGEYKPHGGFRFDTATTSQVSVVSPIDGQIIRGGRLLVSGELQYYFDIITPCGWMLRLGHLLTLTPKFQAIAETFPPAKEMDSRSNSVNPPVAVTAGEEMATAVGVTKGGLNVFFDFGMYDFSKKNAASQNATWEAQHSGELDQYGVCWLDFLPSADSIKVKSLKSGDPKATESDYCS